MARKTENEEASGAGRNAGPRIIDGDLVRQAAASIGEDLDRVDRKDSWSARIYGEACYMAGLDQLISAVEPADVVEFLRIQADQMEAVVLHSSRRAAGATVWRKP